MFWEARALTTLAPFIPTDCASRVQANWANGWNVWPVELLARMYSSGVVRRQCVLRESPVEISVGSDVVVLSSWSFAGDVSDQFALLSRLSVFGDSLLCSRTCLTVFGRLETAGSANVSV